MASSFTDPFNRRQLAMNIWCRHSIEFTKVFPFFEKIFFAVTTPIQPIKLHEEKNENLKHKCVRERERGRGKIRFSRISTTSSQSHSASFRIHYLFLYSLLFFSINKMEPTTEPHIKIRMDYSMLNVNGSRQRLCSNRFAVPKLKTQYKH